MSGDVTPYLDLVTSEHADRSKFIAALTAILQPVADQIAQIESLQMKFDLDTAEGVQLDAVGLWIGRTRWITLPVENLYFSFDENGVGFDEGIWFEQYDPVTKQFPLPDYHYRKLLYAKIAYNNWDGNIPQAYDAWDKLFLPPNHIIVQDNQDMSMLIGVLGPIPDVLTKALLKGGYLALKPVGVRINGYVAPSVSSTPFFGFDVDTDAIKGFDLASWAISI